MTDAEWLELAYRYPEDILTSPRVVRELLLLEDRELYVKIVGAAEEERAEREIQSLLRTSGQVIPEDPLWRDWVEFSIRAAEEVLPLYEAAFPEDVRVREALSAAWAWLRDPTAKRAAWATAAGQAAIDLAPWRLDPKFHRTPAAYAAYAAEEAALSCRRENGGTAHVVASIATALTRAREGTGAFHLALAKARRQQVELAHAVAGRDE